MCLNNGIHHQHSFPLLLVGHRTWTSPASPPYRPPVRSFPRSTAAPRATGRRSGPEMKCPARTTKPPPHQQPPLPLPLPAPRSSSSSRGHPLHPRRRRRTFQHQLQLQLKLHPQLHLHLSPKHQQQQQGTRPWMLCPQQALAAVRTPSRTRPCPGRTRPHKASCTGLVACRCARPPTPGVTHGKGRQRRTARKRPRPPMPPPPPPPPTLCNLEPRRHPPQHLHLHRLQSQ